MTCTCGDDEEEHGYDRKYPGSTTCNVPGCPCIAFESDGSKDDKPVMSKSVLKRLAIQKSKKP